MGCCDWFLPGVVLRNPCFLEDDCCVTTCDSKAHDLSILGPSPSKPLTCVLPLLHAPSLPPLSADAKGWPDSEATAHSPCQANSWWNSFLFLFPLPPFLLKKLFILFPVFCLHMSLHHVHAGEGLELQTYRWLLATVCVGAGSSARAVSALNC